MTISLEYHNVNKQLFKIRLVCQNTLIMITQIVSCFALPQSSPTFAYREAYAPLLCSFLGVSQGHSPTIVQAQVGSDLLTL